MDEYVKNYISVLNDNYRLNKQIVNLKIEVENLKKYKNLEKLKEERELLKEQQKINNLGLNKGDFIYIKHIKSENIFSSQIGFVSRESLHHVRVLVYDKKRNSAHKYTINKNYILGIKHYDGSEKSIISYKKLLELWKEHSKTNKNG